MATLKIFNSNQSVTATSTCSSGVGPSVDSQGRFNVRWSNFSWGSGSLTATLPAVLRRKSTKINSVKLSGSLGSGYLDPSYDNTVYLNKIKSCQTNGTTSFTIVYSYKYNSTITEYFSTQQAAAAAASQSRSRSTSLTGFNITVDYTDFENTISEVGSFDITPSTSKVLGGKSSLGLTVRILPSVAIGAGELAFKIYPEGKSSSGLTFTNSSALAANTEVTYTNTATLFGIVDSNNLGTIYNGKVDVLLNNNKQGDTIDWTSKLQIKSGYEAVGITSNNMFAWSDAQTFYSTYTAFVAGKSTSQVTIDPAYYHYDNFLGDNSVTITLNLSNTTTQYSQTHTLINGLNTFTCPPSASSTDSTVYNYVFTITDTYGGSATYPASGNTAAIRVLSYSDPVVPDDFIFRYTTDTLPPYNEIISDEGTDGKLNGEISVTKFQQYGTAPDQTATNTITMTITVDSTDDSSFGQTLPYTCYSVNFANLTPTNDVYEFDEHITPSSSYKTNNTYNFTLTLTDGVVTVIKSYQFTIAKSYLSIETTGVTVGKGYDSANDGDKTFVVNYPTEITELSKLNGRVYDTGWVDISGYLITSNFLVYDSSANSTPCLRRIGNTIYLRGAIKMKKSLAQGKGYGMFSGIPENLRPDGAYNIMIGSIPIGAILIIGQNSDNSGNSTVYTDDPSAISLRNATSGALGTSGVYINLYCNYTGVV